MQIILNLENVTMHHHQVNKRIRLAFIQLMKVLVQELDNLWNKEVSLVLADIVNPLLVLVFKLFLIL